MALGISRTMVILMAVLAFCAWAVWLGGLAAVQSYCVVGAGFETNVAESNGCNKWYRWYWFLMAFELVLLIAVFATLIARRLAHSRLALMALLTSALTMYIIAANAFLTGLYGNTLGRRNLHAMRAAAAGAIMTAAANALLLCALGTTPEPVGEYGAGKGMGGGVVQQREVVVATNQPVGTMPVAGAV
jgi:glucan phosphoethanolaminetransferase (alkaline phosphatase superfamily)